MAFDVCFEKQESFGIWTARMIVSSSAERLWSLELRGLCKRYGNDVLFDNLDLPVLPGAAIRVSGPNGAGKTQLMMVIAGLVTPDGGSILLHTGENSRLLDRLDSADRAQVALYVPPAPGAIAGLPVDHALLALSRRLRSFSLASRRTAAERLRGELLPEIHSICGQDFDPDRPLGEYSFGQQKRLMALAAASTLSAPLLVMFDEPLAGLDSHGVRTFVDLVQGLRRLGVAVMISEHRVEIDEIVFDKQVSLPFRSSNDVVTEATLTWSAVKSNDGCEAEPLLSVNQVTAGYPQAQVFCSRLDLHPGEMKVLKGSNGSGKTGFIRALLGYQGTMIQGDLKFNGATLLDLRDALHTGQVGYASQKRELFPDLSVCESIEVAGHRGKCSVSAEIREVVQLLGPEKLTKHLSSGGRALVAVTQALASTPRLIILDEPISNVDEENCRRILALLALARERSQCAVLIVEHDMVDQRDVAVHEIRIVGAERILTTTRDDSES